MSADVLTPHSNKKRNQYKDFCHVLDCFNKPKNKIKLSVGKYGNIEINVCDNCLPIFTRQF